MTFDEHPLSAVVDHDLSYGRLDEQILDRLEERQDAIQAAHDAIPLS